VAEEADLTGFDPNMTIQECFMLVGKIALPPIMGNMIQLLVQMITVFFIGRLNDPVLLAAVGLGNMMINVLAFAIT
jgi:Na+-driven multidrug efflux pump